MQITMFQSAKGDCLLLADTAGKTRILVDAGMPDAYSTHVAPAMGKLRTSKKPLDLVYVSHIDEDHIGGVLRMLDDEVLWRVHDHQKQNGNPSHKAPTAPRPPQISAIWHNAFHELLKDNADPIEQALAATAPVLSGSPLEALRALGRTQADLSTSIAQAIRVSRRVGPEQLGISLNTLPGGNGPAKLLMVRNGQQPVTVGGFALTIIGPMPKHLKKLRDDWNTWLKSLEGKKALGKIRKSAQQDETQLGAGDLGRLLAVMALQAETFGKPESVTPPNLASLTLLAEEGGKSLLLTGDARWDEIIEGLEATGRLQPGKMLTLDIVKVPHHGSENNIVDPKFPARVIARDYVFCGDGFSGNPEISVLKLMAKQRLKAPGNFKFWFNSSEAVLTDPKRRAHMREVATTVRALAKSSGGRMTFKFIEDGSSLRVG